MSPSESFVLDRLFATKPKMGCSLLRFPAVQHLECMEDLTGLAPKARFIPVEALECEVWKIG